MLVDTHGSFGLIEHVGVSNQAFGSAYFESKGKANPIQSLKASHLQGLQPDDILPGPLPELAVLPVFFLNMPSGDPSSAWPLQCGSSSFLGRSMSAYFG